MSLSNWLPNWFSKLVPPSIYLACLALPAAAANKTAAIDNWCLAVRNQFLEAAPQFFLGPDPWTPVKRLASFSESGTLATVYYDGRNVRWLLITMQAEDESWFETTHYFFDEQGLLEKRERSLDQYASHIQVHEDEYFHNRQNIKTGYRHSVLHQRDATSDDTSREKENWEAFFDPDAPLYLATSDLPSAFLGVDGSLLAGLSHFSTPQASPSLLKFSGRVISRAEMSSQTTMLNFESNLFAVPGWHLN